MSRRSMFGAKAMLTRCMLNVHAKQVINDIGLVDQGSFAAAPQKMKRRHSETNSSDRGMFFHWKQPLFAVNFGGFCIL